MTISTGKSPILYVVAWLLTLIGVLGLITTLIIEPRYTIVKGMVLISSALIIFGLGEFLNHPKEHSFIETEQGDTKRREYIRRRNTCGLGNLCIIVALLLFFVGLSSLIF
ncbi:MAG: hypothetical protein GY702_03130 [Desulfobulbaceae bacterium]|nr:hypothetical protein [Desulfobulbaceae bacterium]